MPPKDQGTAKDKILNAALLVIRAKGFSATSVDELCAAAGVTKGAFFHHFASKEELGVAAAGHFAKMADGLFATAPYRTLADPLARVLAYIDFRKMILQGDLANFTCLAGTMVQEAYDTYPAIREACEKCICDHAAMVEEDISAAMKARRMKPDWSAQSLALYTQATIQGAFILAKAKHGPEIAAQCIDHLRRYVELLFQQPAKAKQKG